MLDDEHLRARGFWVTAAHPDAGTLPYPGPPFRLPGGGWSLRATAPRLGAGTDANNPAVLTMYGLAIVSLYALTVYRILATIKTAKPQPARA